MLRLTPAGDFGLRCDWPLFVEDEPEEGVDLTSVSVVIEEDDIVASTTTLWSRFFLKMHQQKWIILHFSLKSILSFFDSFFVLPDRKGWILRLYMEKVILTLIEESYSVPVKKWMSSNLWFDFLQFYRFRKIYIVHRIFSTPLENNPTDKFSLQLSALWDLLFDRLRSYNVFSCAVSKKKIERSRKKKERPQERKTLRFKGFKKGHKVNQEKGPSQNSIDLQAVAT